MENLKCVLRGLLADNLLDFVEGRNCRPITWPYNQFETMGLELHDKLPCYREQDHTGLEVDLKNMTHYEDVGDELCRTYQYVLLRECTDKLRERLASQLPIYWTAIHSMTYVHRRGPHFDAQNHGTLS